MNNENKLTLKDEIYSYKQFYSIWDIEKRDPNKLVPYKIRGSCPIEIPIECINRFSKKGELILDPFCGSGTTLIAAAYLKRRALAIEINKEILNLALRNIDHNYKNDQLKNWLPFQKIIEGDALKWMNSYIKENSIDLIFAHPPYWKLIDYSNLYDNRIDNDLSIIEDFNCFLSKVDIMYKGMFRVLKPDRYLCILIGDYYYHNKLQIPLDHYFTDIATKNQFYFVTKIIKVTRNSFTIRNRLDNLINLSKKTNYFIPIHDYLIIFKKSIKL